MLEVRLGWSAGCLHEPGYHENQPVGYYNDHYAYVYIRVGDFLWY